MSEMERRGGFRLNPIAAFREGLDRLASRRVASGVRGVYIPPTGLIDDWHEVGASGEPSFQNSWANFGSGNNATAAFRKDGEGTVHIKGLVSSGSIGSSIFTLPVGYRPALDHNIAVISNNALGRLEVQLSGVMLPVAGSNVWFSIHISFPAEQ